MSVKSRILQFQNQSNSDHQEIRSNMITDVKSSSSCVTFNNGTSINGNNHNYSNKSISPTPPPTQHKESSEAVMSNNLYNNNNKTMSSNSQLSTKQNSIEKPVTMSKKTSLSINLNSTMSPSPMNASQRGNNGSIRNSNEMLSSPTKSFSKQPRTPTRTTSSIPKPTTPTASTPVMSNNGFASRGNLWNSNGFSHHNGLSTKTSVESIVSPGSGQSRFSDSSISWKDKFEESEKKRKEAETKTQHVVTLAQKATRDYEELRRRFNDSCAERDKLSSKLVGANNQLDSLRRVSEATLEDYFKLKKQYETENRNKSEALNRVDQYNKENRRLKRTSALMMQHIVSDTNFSQIEEEAEGAADNVENDKEIEYLRKKNQGLEQKIVILESELEKTKLAEFETQESVMLMNDAVCTTKSDAVRLKELVRKLEDENRKLHDSLDDALVELDSIKSRELVEHDKLKTAENELRRIRTEKNILQRQSLVFMSDTSDHRLMDALAQIGDLQTALEEQKNNFQSQINELQRFISEKAVQEDTIRIQVDAHVKSLEDEVNSLRDRAEEAERKLEDFPPETESFVPPPPPPPPPMGGVCPPPPPPLPSLNFSISSGLKTLKKTTTTMGELSENGSDGSKIQQANPQIDDVVSQIKKGIKLRPMDKTLTRKPTEAVDKPPESQAVEEMRSILNNLKRTRRF